MVNKVTLLGHLGKDPEIRTLDNGAKVANFSLATGKKYQDKNGEWKELTEWHNIVAWRNQADKCEKLKKGDLVYIDGEINYREYEDKDGKKHKVTDIVASYVRNIMTKGEGANQGVTDQVSDHDADHEEDDSLPF